MTASPSWFLAFGAWQRRLWLVRLGIGRKGGHARSNVLLELGENAQEIAQIAGRQIEQRAPEDLHRLDLDLAGETRSFVAQANEDDAAIGRGAFTANQALPLHAVDDSGHGAVLGADALRERRE